MEPVADLDIRLPPRGSRQRLRALHAQLRDGIARGRLHAGFLLPSTRELARTYGVSRNTAIAAYDLLAAEGYLVTRAGGGTFVAAVALRRLPRTSDAFRDRGDLRLSAYWRHRVALPLPPPEPSVEFDFAVGLPEKGEFPFQTWRRLSARALRVLSKTPPIYAEPEGRETLRQAVSVHVSYARAVACRAEDVVVTSGAQQAFDLLARILVTPRRTVVAMEDPGYPPMRRAFEALGARIAYVPVDKQGMKTDRIPSDARIICVTPSHQFPLGMALSMERRKALLELARRRNAVIIEDDYDGEFRYGGRPLDALQTLDGEERVFYVGTFSKSLFPALRLGYVVTPSWARQALVAAKQDSDWHCAVLPQDTLAAFIAEGHLARHVRKMRRIYGERREIALEAIKRHLAGRLDAMPSDIGLHFACMLSDRRRADGIVARAKVVGIRVQTLAGFGVHSLHYGVILGLGRIPSERIDRAVRKLASVI